MSRQILRRVAAKTAGAALVLAAAGATTGVVAAAEQADDHAGVQAPADQAADGLQTAEDAKADDSDDLDELEAAGEQAGGLPDDLPDKAVADEVLEVITTWEGERGAEFGAAVSEAAQANHQGDSAPEEAGAPEDAGTQADDVRKDGEHRPADD